ncbi:hypothetical protein ACOSQ2_010254 [Xanthoceras sorbifolium]
MATRTFVNTFFGREPAGTFFIRELASTFFRQEPASTFFGQEPENLRGPYLSDAPRASLRTLFVREPASTCEDLICLRTSGAPSFAENL